MKSFKRDSSFSFSTTYILKLINVFGARFIFFFSFRFYYCSNQSYKYIERYCCHVRITFIDAKDIAAMEKQKIQSEQKRMKIIGKVYNSFHFCFWYSCGDISYFFFFSIFYIFMLVLFCFFIILVLCSRTNELCL